MPLFLCKTSPMSDSLIYIAEHFKGSFIAEPSVLQQKLAKVKAYVFDWDGVFNNGQKDGDGSSPFNEVDAMGTNLLRFNHYLNTNHLPVVAVISGERNTAAFSLAKREHFHAVYCGVKNKVEALDHLCFAYNLSSAEVAFVFDDVLDLSMAAVTGLRIMVSRACNPLLTDYVVQRQYADYLTYCTGAENGVRESIELMMGIRGKYVQTIDERMNYTETYKQYLQKRNEPTPLFYKSESSKIIEDTIS